MSKNTSILKQIEAVLNDYSFRHNGLMTGHQGKILWHAVNYLYSEDPDHQDLYIDGVADLAHYHGEITDLSQASLFSICAGAAGEIWLIQYLIEKGALEPYYLDILSKMPANMAQSILIDLESKNYDYLHGALGKGIPYLDQEDNTLLEDFVQKTLSMAEIDEKYCIWRDYVTPSLEHRRETMGDKIVYNASHSHGMASIITYLSLAYPRISSTELKEKTAEAIKKCIAFYEEKLKQENARELYASFYTGEKPQGIDRLYHSLKWCYGDFGTANMFYHAGVALENESYKEESKRIFHSCATRTDEAPLVNDAMFCHGTGGIAYCFLAAYQKHKTPELWEAAQFWLEETLNRQTDKGPAGYQSHRGEEGFIDEYAMLEGIVGLGLVLLCFEHPEENLGWDRLFLLN